MAYRLKEITIKTDNSKEGIVKINEIWKDIAGGRLPILFDSESNMQKDISLIAKYYNYENFEEGNYDLTIMVVEPEFYEEMEKQVQSGTYKKYDVSDDTISLCAKRAWEKVWEDKKTRKISRTYSEDFECTVPAQFTEDGMNHCCLYIAVEK